MVDQISEVEKDPWEEFDPRVRDDVEGLIYLGYLTDDFEWCGHHFQIKTLKGDEDLAAAQASAPYRDTLKEAEAFASAQVGLALLAVDGDTAFCPPAGPDKEAYAKARFNYINSRWHWPTIRFIFDKYIALQNRQRAAYQAVQDLSSGSQPIFLPSLDSLTEPGISSDPES